MQYHRYKDENTITCNLCKHFCDLKGTNVGVCGVNSNKNGSLYTLTYGYPSALHIDPIEKKPLYHFHPASQSLSLGTVGCNFRCPFCQNHTISQTNQLTTKNYYAPEDIVTLAQQHNVKSISYTYNEPTIWYPYARDIGILAKEYGIKNVFVSSGYESQAVLDDMQQWIDGINVDLKSFSHRYYKEVLKTDLDGVKESLAFLAQSDIWVEVTTLLIPGVNDSKEELEAMAQFIYTTMGATTPWHLNAFYPNYKMLDHPITPIVTLEKGYKIAKDVGLEFVYLGNVDNINHTSCPHCGTILLTRHRYNTTVVDLEIESGVCRVCHTKIAGVWR